MDFPTVKLYSKKLANKYELTIHKLNMSEFIKADGALTCCSVFVKFKC